ncbi:MAG: acyl-ACP--UDP-N-acetylglucosamine O-acyltransferase [Planctomycetota bacterium]|nr:acyl-ACP--UDP-N-acetylglucosamine O-acyltransferase [Planctomycetota bacterium]
MGEIHPTAIVDRRAELAATVSVGAYSIIKAGVVLGAGTVVHEHCHIHGNTTIGLNGQIGPAAFVGLAPQHLKHDGKDASLIIGDNVIIREMASVHRSIKAGAENATRIGNRCMLMASSHVGHDCVVGEDVILANAALLGGHCQLGNKTFIGGGATLHQFVRVGRLAIIAGNEALTHDVPPFGAMRYRGLKGYNAIGCKRSGMSRDSIDAVRKAFRMLHTNRTLPAAIKAIREQVPPVPEVLEMLAFIAATHRGIAPSVRFRQSISESITGHSE